mgnify:CR=1 FL=1
MKRGMMTWVGLLVAGFLLAGVSVAAQQEAVNALDVKAIKSMQLQEKSGKYIAEVGVIFVNKSDKESKMRKATFDVAFKSGDVSIPFGKANLDELVLPAGEKAEDGTVTSAEKEVTLTVTVGPKDSETFSRLVGLFNIIGNPESELTMQLNGQGELGMKVDKGWVYQQNMAVELEFVPTIAREVLFK